MTDFMQLNKEVPVMDFTLFKGIDFFNGTTETGFEKFISSLKSNVIFNLEKSQDLKTDKDIVIFYNPDNFLGRKYSYFGNKLFEDKDVNLQIRTNKRKKQKNVQFLVDLKKLKNHNGLKTLSTSSFKVADALEFLKSIESRVVDFHDGGLLVKNKNIHITEIMLGLEEHGIKYRFNGVDLVIL